MASTSIERHIKVKGDASPDNLELREYWAKRAEKSGKSYWEKNSRNYKIASNQNWKCPLCGEPLLNSETIETHHQVPIKDGGTDEVNNLIHLHKTCHQQVHGRKPNVRALEAISFECRINSGDYLSYLEHQQDSVGIFFVER